MKVLPVGAELFHVDGRTEMTKLIVAFRYFMNAPTTFQLVRKTMSMPTLLHGCDNWTFNEVVWKNN